jgi:ribosomal-protein-alanine acetyltransferase
MAAETNRERVVAMIRPFREADAAAVTEILRASPEASQWTEWGFKELLGWRGVLALVSEDARKVSGFIVGRQVGEEAEILNLAVTVANRRKGEGRALLKRALEEFRTRQVSRVFLEVRESNERGIAFYARHGFSKTGRRASYYHDPEETAIVMEIKLGG